MKTKSDFDWRALSRVLPRVLVLVAALGGVLWAIRSLNAGSMDKVFAAFGLQMGGPGAPGLQAAGRSLQSGEERLNLCPTRITGFVWHADPGPARRSIEEKREQSGLKMHWFAYDPTERELGYLEIEKWLTRHCQVAARLVSDADLPPNEPRSPLELRYVDGSSLSIEVIGQWGGDRFFRIGDRYYRSDDFASALDELLTVAQIRIQK